jgi:hypothetical protein
MSLIGHPAANYFDLKTRAADLDLLACGRRMASNPCAEGIEAIVFRTIGDPPSSWESSLPPELLPQFLR